MICYNFFQIKYLKLFGWLIIFCRHIVKAQLFVLLESSFIACYLQSIIRFVIVFHTLKHSKSNKLAYTWYISARKTPNCCQRQLINVSLTLSLRGSIVLEQISLPRFCLFLMYHFPGCSETEIPVWSICLSIYEYFRFNTI